MENLIENEDFTLIQGWMLRELNLSGTELLVYAKIYSLSSTIGSFRGSLQYLANWSNSSTRNVQRVLTSLTDRGLIIKDEIIRNGVKLVEYSVNAMTKCRGYGQNVVGSDKMSNNNTEKENNNIIINNNNYLKENNVKTTEKEPRHRFGEFGRVLLTDKEYTKLVADFGQDVINEQIKLLDEYVEGNNNKNKYTNFNLVLRKSIRDKWFVRNSNSSSTNKTPRTSEPDWLQNYVDTFEDGVEDL